MQRWCKICGITRLVDAQDTQAAGADAIGLNFYPRSPRYLSIEQAAAISSDVTITRVGLFVDAQADEVKAVLENVALDMLQFHGSEPPEFCDQFDMPYIKVLRVSAALDSGVNAEEDLKARIERYKDAWAVLLDTHVKGQPGGTGQTFDWDIWPKDVNARLILAGGLTPQNVQEAIAATQPFGVDVAGGVESSPGIKSPDQVRAFIEQAQSM